MTVRVLVLGRALINAIAVARAIGAEAHRVLAIALRWNVRPRSPFGDKCPDPVRVVAAICQQSRATREVLQQDRAEPVVMRRVGDHRCPADHAMVRLSARSRRCR